jgi:hypothetical protein
VLPFLIMQSILRYECRQMVPLEEHYTELR